jgi:hypothetical protein
MSKDFTLSNTLSVQFETRFVVCIVCWFYPHRKAYTLVQVFGGKLFVLTLKWTCELWVKIKVGRFLGIEWESSPFLGRFPFWILSIIKKNSHNSKKLSFPILNKLKTNQVHFVKKTWYLNSVLGLNPIPPLTFVYNKTKLKVHVRC